MDQKLIERAAYHGITDLDWYVWTENGFTERFSDPNAAAAKAVELYGEPSCGRGGWCSDIAPQYCGKKDDKIVVLEAWLETNDEEWYENWFKEDES